MAPMTSKIGFDGGIMESNFDNDTDLCNNFDSLPSIGKPEKTSEISETENECQMVPVKTSKRARARAWMRAHGVHPAFLRKRWWRALLFRALPAVEGEVEPDSPRNAPRPRLLTREDLVAAQIRATQIRQAYLWTLGFERQGACRARGRAASSDVIAPDMELVRCSSQQLLHPGGGASPRHRARLLQNVLMPVAHKSRPQQTIIVFDWDDTLLPTGRLVGGSNCNGDFLIGRHSFSNDAREAMDALELIVKELLLKSMALGTTVIVTNAVEGWVEETSSKYFPSLMPVLEKMRIISARDRYLSQFPDDPAQWKMQVFLDLQRELDPQSVMNMLAFGDADYEIQAAHALRGKMPQSVIKTLKFCPNPTVKYLALELKFVKDQLAKLVAEPRSKALEVPGAAVRRLTSSPTPMQRGRR